MTFPQYQQSNSRNKINEFHIRLLHPKWAKCCFEKLKKIKINGEIYYIQKLKDKIVKTSSPQINP
jgi:hypothetical protein